MICSILWAALGVLLLLGAVAVGVCLFTFDHPPKNRMDPRKDAMLRQYGPLAGEILPVFDEMDAMEKTDLSVTSFDGLKLTGRYFEFRKDAPCVISFHGYHGSWMLDGQGMFKYCRDRGLNLLAVDQRAHGQSDGRTVTFGIRERQDVPVWIRKALELLGEETPILLSGVSMGSATVLMSIDQNLPANVRAIIADCGYTSPKEIIINTAKGMGLPGKLLYPLARLCARILYGFDPDSCAALDTVQLPHPPVLIIHGDADDFVPLNMGKRLYEACSGEKHLAVIPGAGHAVAAMKNYSAYLAAVDSFLTEVAGLQI